MTLTTSFNRQEEAQQRLLSSLERAHHSANTTFERLSVTMGMLSKSLDEADMKIRSWSMNSMGQAWIQLGILILGLGILLSKEGSKVVLMFVGVLGSYRY